MLEQNEIFDKELQSSKNKTNRTKQKNTAKQNINPRVEK